MEGQLLVSCDDPLFPLWKRWRNEHPGDNRALEAFFLKPADAAAGVAAGVLLLVEDPELVYEVKKSWDAMRLLSGPSDDRSACVVGPV